eukprot:3770738-Ditylum_brightwellii.AAC.1
MPHLSTADAATQAATDLIAALKKPAPAAPFRSLTTQHHTALCQLAEIFNSATVPTSEPILKFKPPEEPTSTQPVVDLVPTPR